MFHCLLSPLGNRPGICTDIEGTLVQLLSLLLLKVSLGCKSLSTQKCVFPMFMSHQISDLYLCSLQQDRPDMAANKCLMQETPIKGGSNFYRTLARKNRSAATGPKLNITGPVCRI